MSQGDLLGTIFKLYMKIEILIIGVIINKPPRDVNYNPEQTIVFCMEPHMDKHLHWNNWYTSKRDFMYFLDHQSSHNNVEWHLGLNYNELSDNIQISRMGS